MKAVELCPSPHIEAADIGPELGNERVYTIKTVSKGLVGADQVEKGIIHFDEDKRGMVVNRTNIKVLIELLGGETDEWIGKRIALYRSEASYNGKVVPAIRVRAKLPKDVTAPA